MLAEGLARRCGSAVLRPARDWRPAGGPDRLPLRPGLSSGDGLAGLPFLPSGGRRESQGRCAAQRREPLRLRGPSFRSRSHVLKLFRRHLGVSAKGYVISRQLREARELLLGTTLPVSEVGKAVGLPDPYHFSKLFRKHVGLSPREFREQHGPFSTPPKPSSHETTPPRV
ncbi:MAG: AraC family transcriptional regulator [Opitutus sp.]|nr:AraC family transcriptional regulator [Opitutus sp.]